MRFLSIAGLCIWLTPAFSQKAEQLLFRETTHDFGNVPEKGGPVEHEFGFINNSGQPLVLVNVEASCGCTTPEWSRETIAPGKQGLVRARFDPEGRPGFFRKTITLTTSPDIGPVVLQINGNVTEKVSVSEEVLEFANGQLQTRSSGFNLGKVFLNRDAASRSFTVRNNGGSLLEITGSETPPYMSVKYPARLVPGEKGTLLITYDARKRNTYGFVTERLVLKTNDPVNAEKQYPVFATLEESFTGISEEERKNGPRMILGIEDLKFGEVAKSASLDREIEFKNTGKRELIIRSLVSNCACIMANAVPEIGRAHV